MSKQVHPALGTEPVSARVSIGLFAHDEQDRIAAMLARLDSLDLAGLDVELIVLANGCTDRTAEVAAAAVANLSNGFAHAAVVELPRIGKCGTWNRFVHELSSPGCEFLVFLDADIEFGHPGVMRGLVQLLADRPHAHAAVSRPTKRVAPGAGLFGRLSARSADTYDPAIAICGQLWAVRSCFVRRFRLPTGLPVEDGFCRALVVTDLFTGPRGVEHVTRIATNPDVFHYFHPEPTFRGWLRHERRLLAASTINRFVYDMLWQRSGPDYDAGRVMQALEDRSPKWLSDLVRERLRERRWVLPAEFLSRRFRAADGSSLRLRSWPKCLVMTALDWMAAMSANRMLHANPDSPRRDSWLRFLD